MKKMFRIGFFALFLTAVSCQDAYDITQDGELNEETAFKTLADLQTGLSGIYDSYTPDAGSNGSGEAVLFNDLFTDNLKRGKDGNGQGSSEYNFIIQPADTAPETLWSARYYTINLCNRVLRSYDRLAPTFTDAQLEEAQQLKGQVLAMRALAHLDLFEYYTTDYKDPTALAVIKMDFVPNIVDEFERNTVAEITQFIQSDLTSAASLMGDFNTSGGPTGTVTNKIYLSKYAIMCINARLATDIGDSALALSLVTELEGVFPLSGGAEYDAMFTNDSDASELIMKLKRLVSGDNRIGGLYYANAVNTGGSPFLEASNQLYNLYSGTDARKALFFNFVGANDNGNEILITKYPGTSTANQLVNDFKLFRMSEMELIKAEAQARLGDLAGAAVTMTDLKQKRDPAATAVSYGSLTTALTDILLERRKELAFEGHRYLDLKRLGKELNIDVNRDQIDADTFSAPTFISSDDYRFTFPIPSSEFDGNDKITQNPGYPST